MIEVKTDKAAERKARAVLKNEERFERTDLDQLILLHTDKSRGRCLKEKARLKTKLRARYADDAQAMHAVIAELKAKGIDL